MTATTCGVCDRSVDSTLGRTVLAEGVAARLERRRPGWTTATGRACLDCINDARATHLEGMLKEAAGRSVPAADPVIASIRTGGMLSAGDAADRMMSLARAEVAADRFTALIATWWFAGLVLAGLGVWVTVNVAFRPLEPYPVIILAMISAVLASVAALEGPIIMMSQRRTHRLEVARTEQDFLVNLRAELEVRYLGEQVQHLIGLTEQLLETAKGQKPGSSQR